MKAKDILIIAGCLSATIAILHVIVIFVGAPAYRYFGAGEDMARQAEAGSILPAAITTVITAVFVIFALYAFGAARLIATPPLLRTGLVTIGVIYTLRGLVLAHQLPALLSNAPGVAPKDLVFSAVSLATGIAYLLGTWLSWRDLPHRRWRVA
ncbi:MAG: hypothetical protein ABUT39_21740 [Acidobacteriota bacterium]